MSWLKFLFPEDTNRTLNFLSSIFSWNQGKQKMRDKK
jgi:hypothetical protein